MKPYNIGTILNINDSIFSNSMVPTLYYFSPNNLKSKSHTISQLQSKLMSQPFSHKVRTQTVVESQNSKKVIQSVTESVSQS